MKPLEANAVAYAEKETSGTFLLHVEKNFALSMPTGRIYACIKDRYGYNEVHVICHSNVQSEAMTRSEVVSRVVIYYI